MINLLRQATRAQHEALHVHPLLAPLQDDSITLDDYKWCIRGFYAAYHRVQAAMTYAPLPDFDVPALDWLEQDMRTHGIVLSHVSATDYPVIDSYSRYIGLAYVKQGSTLGGRMISKHLVRTLALQEIAGNRFFAGFGDETGLRWKDFAARLEDDSLEQDAVIEQALRTFELIAKCCDLVLDNKRAKV